MPPDAYKGMAPDGKAQFMGKGSPEKGFGGKGDFDGKDGKGFGGKEPFMGKDMDGKGFGGKDPMVIFVFFWIERNRRFWRNYSGSYVGASAIRPNIWTIHFLLYRRRTHRAPI